MSFTSCYENGCDIIMQRTLCGSLGTLVVCCHFGVKFPTGIEKISRSSIRPVNHFFMHFWEIFSDNKNAFLYDWRVICFVLHEFNGIDVIISMLLSVCELLYLTQHNRLFQVNRMPLNNLTERNLVITVT